MTHADVLAELFTLLGLAGAALFGALWVALRSVRGGWCEVPAEVVDGQLRWMALDGTFHSAELGDGGDWEGPGDRHVFYRRRAPHRHYSRPVAHDERALAVVAVSLAGVAIVAIATSMVLLFV